MSSKPNSTVLVVFDKDFSSRHVLSQKFDTIIADRIFQKDVEALGSEFIELESLVGPGSIYEASALLEELSELTLPNGVRIAKSFMYKGYELWWINYNNLFFYFCLPYTRYKKLLEYVKNFHKIHFYNPPYKSLFTCYLSVYERKVLVIRKSGFRTPSFLPFGIFIQIVITFLCIPILIVRKTRIMIFIGDKFEKSKDYDFRMKFIYEELRQKDLRFVEFIRSLGSWKTILEHALKRRRPVIYSGGITFVGRFISFISGGRIRAKRRFGTDTFLSVPDKEERFKLVVATQYLLSAYDDVWAIRITKWILRIIGVKAAFITAATERNFHAVLGCKLNTIPTVGILHAFASRYYNGYDFMPCFDGTKSLSVDTYGVWSEWWKEHYIRNSKAYRPEQLVISGPMRPLQKPVISTDNIDHKKTQEIKVLLVSEIVAIPIEVMPYLDAILEVQDFSVYIKFRAHGDSFEKWLEDNRPDVLSGLGNDRILKGSMEEAIGLCDVVIGSQSTGVIEATMQSKPFVFFSTKKWGDYFDMKSFDTKHHFFAEDQEELVDYIKESRKIPKDVLKNFRDQFFGDPRKNGSKWAVEQLSKIIKSCQ